MSAAAARGAVAVPGRVNLIGEHIDYHDLPVLPVALDRRITAEWQAVEEPVVRARSEGFGEREFRLDGPLEPWPAGDWGNYVKAAASAARQRWPLARGVVLEIRSTLPVAAGLSSSTALMTACTLALLEANGIRAGFGELMEILPEGEYFVGTRGGGMDHAVVLGAREGCALLVEFAPVRATPVPVPEGWVFLAADSGVQAEKSAAVREQYNERRFAGQRAAQRLGFAGIRQALEQAGAAELRRMAEARLDGMERRCFLHAAGEAERVREAVEAMRTADAERFGRLLNESHASLRDLLAVSCAELDALTEAARQAGALGARLTGAGFGGSAVVFCLEEDAERVAAEIGRRFYGGRAEGRLFRAVPSAGALELIARAGG
ncbi:MAG: hypothetical protein N2036_11595 [Bryobacteraceae bacterium]|nr:hypothetical protein [Bryobacteraceae bacterium]